MSGRGKALKKKSRISRSIRAGLIFPVSRMYRNVKRGDFRHRRIAVGAPIYTAAVIEYLCAEVLELAGNAAADNKKKRITPRHVMLAVSCDDELNRVCTHLKMHLVANTYISCLTHSLLGLTVW